MAYSMQSSFLDINPGDLNKFIDDKLQPDQGFLSECSKNMDFLAEFLRNKSDFSVAETIKVGIFSFVLWATLLPFLTEDEPCWWFGNILTSPH